MRMLCVLASLALLSPTRSTVQEPVFSSKVEAVRVDVLVTERGQPVRGLGVADFDVLDNGVLQQVELVSFEQVPLNLVLVLDMSSSVVGDRLEHLRDGAQTVLRGLKREDQAGLITFSHVVVRGSALTSNLDQVRLALRGGFWPGSTSLIDAVYTGIMLGESDAGRALLIVFSDGLDTSSWLSADTVRDIARRSDVVAYGVTAGRPPRMAFLRDLTELTGGALLDAGSSQNLGATFEKILDEFRQRYLVSYSPRGVQRAGWHRLDVRLKGRSGTVTARPGYLAN